MKRLISKSEREKKAKKNQIIIGIILAFLLVLSILGFALQGNTGSRGEDKITYNGLEFIYSDGFWRIGSFAFRYNPEQVPEIGSGLRDFTFYQKLPLYIYSENIGAENELNMNLGLIAERVQKACLNEKGIICSEELPVKTCKDNFIIIKKSNNTEITQDNNCVYIEGPEEELLKLTDQFLFKIFGIK